MGGGGGDGGALTQERQQLEAQQQLLNEKRKKLEEQRIAGLRAQFTKGGLEAPATQATAPTTLGGATPPTPPVGRGR